LETLLSQKNPSIRFQILKERETKELLDPQSIQSSQQQLQTSFSDKATNISEKIRAGSSYKSTS
jgi:hypothetical protein